MNFTKLQGAGNDFVLVETADTQREWSEVAIAICDRHFGVGADGLLLLLPSAKADFQMRIFDADGSEAEACGNGIRCLARYVFEKGLVRSRDDQILVETLAGIRKIKLHKNGDEPSVIQAGMGEPKFAAADIPLVIKPGDSNIVDIKSTLSYPVTVGGTDILLNLVSMGNPHAVCFWENPVADFPLARLGPKVERLAIFPNKINFEIARVLGRQQIEARVWERGVGETLACGSGACAIMVTAQRQGYIGGKADIKLPGGVLKVEWDGAGEVFLNGPAEIVFSGEWPEAE